MNARALQGASESFSCGHWCGVPCKHKFELVCLLLQPQIFTNFGVKVRQKLNQKVQSHRLGQKSDWDEERDWILMKKLVFQNFVVAWPFLRISIEQKRN